MQQIRRSSAVPMRAFVSVACALMTASPCVFAQDVPIADPASLAFEAGRWEDAIHEYELILEGYPEDRMSRLRIAQAERELGQYQIALATLDEAQAAFAPEAMVDFERALNLVALGRRNQAIAALESADHQGLRALGLLEDSPDLDPLRDSRAFERVLASVRARVYPCESIPEARAFDFWVGRWEVRTSAGALAGHNTITKRDGGCTIHEQWEGAAGATGTSTSFYIPSRGQWRQVWIGSGGTLIDITGGPVDGEMVMEGTIEYVDQENVVAFRGRWSRAPDGRVRQRFEQFNLAGATWDLWFDGFYHRIDGADGIPIDE